MKVYTHIQNLMKGLVILSITLFTINTAQAQQPDTKGTDFWLAFPGNNGGGGSLYFYVSGETSTTGSVTASGFSTTFSVTPGSVTIVTIPGSFNINEDNLVENKGIHVTAEDEITIYGLNQQGATTDAYVALPTDILGTEYIALGYTYHNTGNIPSQLTIVATENATSVTLTLTESASGFSAGVPSTITLDQGETFLIESTDGTGSLITSDKPIGLYGGSECTNIPSTAYFACDHIVEMLPPVSTWGKNFVVMPLATRNGSTYRILASENSTAVTINGSLATTLNKGQFYQTTRTTALHITTDKPVLVGQYAHSSSYDNAVSDPFFMIIPPYEQYLGSYTVATPGTGFSTHWINVVAPAAAVGEAEIDGSAIPSSSFSAIGTSGFYGATVQVSNGSHTINSSFPIGTHMYGWGNYDSYGYPGGASLAPVAFVDDLSVSPTTATLNQFDEHCITATVLDNNGDPVEGIRVDFAVTGANTTGGFATTDANGEATFCYTDAVGGSDNIEITTGTLTENATAYFSPCNIFITNTNTKATCTEGGSIDITVTGATEPYTVTWTGPDSYTSGDEDISDLDPGIYEVTVLDANGCEGSSSVEISLDPDVTDPVAVTQNITVTLDANGEATIAASDIDNGSTDNCGISSYMLDITAFDCEDVGENTVTLTVEDASGNTASATATVTVTSTLTADAGSDVTVYYGYSPMASTTLSGSGNGGGGTYTYAWSNSANTQNTTVSPTSTTTYTLTVTDNNGCIATDEVEVTVVDVRCGKNMNKVAMCHDGNPICIASSAVSSHLANHSDCYLGPCQSSSKRDFGFTEEEDEHEAEQETGESLNTTGFSVYPNPFAGNATLQFSVAEDQRVAVDIYDAKGALVQNIYNGDVKAGVVYKIAIDATKMPATMYFARLVSNSGIQNIKIVQTK